MSLLLSEIRKEQTLYQRRQKKNQNQKCQAARCPSLAKQAELPDGHTKLAKNTGRGRQERIGKKGWEKGCRLLTGFGLLDLPWQTRNLTKGNGVKRKSPKKLAKARPRRRCAFAKESMAGFSVPEPVAKRKAWQKVEKKVSLEEKNVWKNSTAYSTILYRKGGQTNERYHQAYRRAFSWRANTI